MALNEMKLKQLCERVYSGNMIEQKNEKGEMVSDANDIKQYCERVFGDGSVTPDPSLLHQFNNLIVKTADKMAEPKIQEMMNVLATFQTANPGDVVVYDMPKDSKAKILWTALGSGVDLVRISPEITKTPAIARAHTFGAYYEPLDFVRNSVEAFKKAVDMVAEAKVKKYYDIIRELVVSAVASGTIPANNVLTGSNLTLTQYRQLESRLARFGGRPTFIADSLLIDHLANQQATDPVFKELLVDETRMALMSELYLRGLSKSIAVNLTNPFTDETNTKVEFPVNEGFVFAGSMAGKKPFMVTEFGSMRQYTEQDAETERIKLKIVFEADVTLFYGNQIGRVVDDTVTL